MAAEIESNVVAERTAIPFTQFVAPHGRQKTVFIQVRPDVADKAHSLIARGLSFECEVLSTGEVSATITDPEEGDLDIVVVPNGPGVREAIERMIEEFASLSSGSAR